MIKLGASVTSSSTKGLTALHLASYANFHRRGGDAAVQRGPASMEKDDRGVTALYYACIGGEPQRRHRCSFRRAPTLTPPPKTDPHHGCGASRQATLGSSESCWRAGADVTKANEATGNTPLLYACSGGQLDVVRLLLEMKADPNQVGAAGLTPLTEVCIRGNYDIAKLLLSYGADREKGVRGVTRSD
ncbi:unnamed protein product [Sphagnum tenellum]